MPRLTHQHLDRMSADDVTEIYETMKKAKRIPMVPPRRPRGEKPATTIRLQRRQIAQMEQTIDSLRLAADDKDKVIAGYDAQLSEANDEISEMRCRGAERSIQAGEAIGKLNEQSKRLAYLEGYFYAKEKEAPQTEILAKGRCIVGNQPDTDHREGPRDTQDVPHGRSAAEGAWASPSSLGFSEEAGGQVRRERADYRPYTAGDPVDHIKMSDIDILHPGRIKWVDK